MKKLILSVACVLAAVSAYAQGTVTFANIGVGLSAPVFDIDGTTRLAGTAFMAQLYVGSSSAESSLTAVAGTANFLTAANAGFFSGGTKTLTGFAGGTKPFLQVRAWAASGGASYEAALAAGAKAGKSTVFQMVNALGNPAGEPPTPAGNIAGLTSFSLVPEPSIIALGILGAAALLIRRRK